MKNLINTEEANSFISLMGTPTGRAAHLHSAEKVDAQVRPHVIQSHIVMEDAVNKLVLLVDDPTRPSLVEKHAAAAILADRVTAQLKKAQGEIQKRAEDMISSAETRASIRFSPDVQKSALDTAIMNYMREQSVAEEGVEKIRQAVLSSHDAARVLSFAPPFLTGLAESVHTKLKYEALEKHHPDIYNDLAHGHFLADLPKKYENVITQVRRSFAKQGLANEVKRRVEV
jgi:hypothetical protein